MVEQSQSSEVHEAPKSEFIAKLEKLWAKGNFVCVGLDSDWSNIPEHLKSLGREEGTLRFNQENVDTTADLVCAYKPNIAFYEDSTEGEKALERTVRYIHKKYPGIPIIGDIKRGDIGNTNSGYVQAAFERYNFDAVTCPSISGQRSLKAFS